MRLKNLFVVIVLSLVACDDGGTSDVPEGDSGAVDSGVADASDTGPPPADAALPCSAPELPDLALEELVDHSFSNPVFMTQAPGDDESFYVVEQAGRILIVRDGDVLGTPFLDIRNSAQCTGDCVAPVDSETFGEMGMLGLAFHPDYEDNGRFFVYFNPDEHGGDDPESNVVAEFRRSTNPDVADNEEVARLVEVDSPQVNHRGGNLMFGPDGFLYVGVGDGGGGGDDGTGHNAMIGNGQDTDTLFGKILRLDVDNAGNGYIADGNPFVGMDGDDEIWAYGLRNPWRFSFDGETGDLYIGDVGQDVWEEISFQPAESPGGLNYGWRKYEGFAVYRSDDPAVPNHTPPLIALQHSLEEGDTGEDTGYLRGACSITGGYVYRGDEIPELQGVYFYGDFCSFDIGAFRYCDGEVVGNQWVADEDLEEDGLSSFAEDHEGNLYLVYLDGPIYRITAP